MDVDKAITKYTGLVSIMAGNNEIGTEQPILNIADIATDRDIIFHTDAVQAYCHTKIDVDEMGIDLLSASAHKFHGPKGVGFLYISDYTYKESFMFGGQQQFGMRPGTENVPGIMGMAKAVELNKYNDSEMTKLWYLFETELFDAIPNIHLNGGIIRLANNLNIRFDGIQGEVLLAMLNERGVCVSSGSACTSESGEPSHVLKAIGLTDEEARSSLRFTMSEFTTKEEIYEAVRIIKDCVERLRDL
jgi:cysteine desulfurase